MIVASFINKASGSASADGRPCRRARAPNPGPAGAPSGSGMGRGSGRGEGEIRGVAALRGDVELQDRLLLVVPIRDLDPCRLGPLRAVVRGVARLLEHGDP